MHEATIAPQAVFWRLYVAAVADNESPGLIDRRRSQLERSGVNADAVELAYCTGLSQLRIRREFPGALPTSSGEDWN